MEADDHIWAVTINDQWRVFVAADTATGAGLAGEELWDEHHPEQPLDSLETRRRDDLLHVRPPFDGLREILRTNPTPKPAYQRLADDLRRQIETGVLGPGDMIPSTRDLKQQYDIAHMTVRHGIELLKSEGLIVAIAGLGTFVADNA